MIFTITVLLCKVELSERRAPKLGSHDMKEGNLQDVTSQMLFQICVFGSAFFTP